MEAKAPAKGEERRLNFDNPDCVNLLRIVLRGLADDDNLDRSLLAGEMGDPEDDGNTPPPPPPPPDRLPPRVFNPAESEKRRLDVIRAMDAFDDHLERLAGSDAPPPRKLTAETCFILRIAVEASRCAMRIEQDGKTGEVFPLPLLPSGNVRENTFVVRVGRMLQRLWVGSKSKPALLSRLTVGRHLDDLPYDCFALIAFSRWALARSVMSMQACDLRDLSVILQRSAAQIWRATLAWPPIDADAELKFVAQLDEALGIEAAETAGLLAHYRSFGAGLKGEA
ncbi:MAG: hypothetical protein ACT4N8_09890 [Sphingosinicella sp.]|uniref:hypothetical protein n=1 Tax=Sphingosinicella sp. TaxID=1917971 RepID=UPI004037F29B